MVVRILQRKMLKLISLSNIHLYVVAIKALGFKCNLKLLISGV